MSSLLEAWELSTGLFRDGFFSLLAAALAMLAARARWSVPITLLFLA